MKDELLGQIKSPADVKQLAPEQLEELCEEIRRKIIDVVSKNGGHLAPNLGVIELTVALHKVFESPNDTFVWDVGHQSYPHKLLTGRYAAFQTLRRIGGLSGFQTPSESCHDKFVTGHAGSALSSAMGLAAALERSGDKEKKVIAIVGDGALGNGISLEALNNVRGHRSNFILIVNDNKMSISKSVGTISTHLTRVITARGYNRLKTQIKLILKRIPFGHHMIRFIGRVESLTKSMLVSSVLFEEVGFKYVGPIDGHDLPELIKNLEKIKDLNTARPIAFHVITEKGHGCKYAISSPEKFHGVPAFDPKSGELMPPPKNTQTFSAAFGDSLLLLGSKHRNIVALTAAMASGTGLSSFAKHFPDRFFDVGIAEEHAVVFAGGLAAGGFCPVLAVYSTFLQRALDCIFHDVCLPNRKIIFCVDRAGAVEDGPTHHGIYDLPFLLEMPNLAILCPRDATELDVMLNAAYEAEGPVMLRYPRSNAVDPEIPRTPLFWGKAEEIQAGTEIAIWSNGRELLTALAVAAILTGKGKSVSVTNARFLKPFDSERLLADAQTKFLVTVEDSLNAGGLGRIADRLLLNHPNCGVLHCSWPEQFLAHGSVPLLREQYGLLPEQIAVRILKTMEQRRTS